MFKIKLNSAECEIRCVEKGVFRLRVSHDGKFRESLMNRYEILRESGEIEPEVTESADTVKIDAPGASFTLYKSTGEIVMEGAKAPLRFTFAEGDAGRGYKACLLYTS